MEHNQKISIRQLQILLMFDIFGTGIIALPRKVAALAGQDGWILIIGSTIFALIYAMIICSLTNMFRQDTFVEFSQKILTKPIGILLSLILSLKFVATTGLELNALGEIIKQTMLPKTPSYIVIILMLLAAGHVAYNGYECRGRLGEIMLPLAFIPFILVFIIASFETDFTNLKPILVTDTDTIIKGSFFTAFTFSGLEYLLFATPFVNSKGDVAKGVRSGVIIIGLLLTVICIVTLSRFGIHDVTRKLWPVLSMMDTINIPGSFIERQNVLIMSFLIVSVFAITNAGIYFTSLILSRLTYKKQQSKFVLSAMVAVFLVSIYPKNIAETYEYLELITKTFGGFYMVILPIVMIMLAKLRRIGDSNG